MRKVLVAGGALAVLVLVVVGLSQTKGTETEKQTYSAQDAARRLKGSPAPLAALHAQGGQILDGSRNAFRARLDALRGYPVVVNKWASWCGPCRVEFPSFQRASVDFGKRVAFVGLNSNDNLGNAKTFLAKFPVPYPAYADPALKTAPLLGPASYFPLTAFYDKTGKRTYVHAGVYRTTADLADDIERYALGTKR